MTVVEIYPMTVEEARAEAEKAREIGEKFACTIIEQRKLLKWEKFRRKVRKENGLLPLPLTQRTKEVLGSIRIRSKSEV